MIDDRWVKLIEDTCQSDDKAYDQLRHCLSHQVDLDDKPLSPQLAKHTIDELTFRAQKGKARAKSLLGNIYFNGWGVASDLKKALCYARHAASLGDAGGEVLLGFFYLEGLGGIVKNYDRAIHFFKKALEKEHSMAFNNLGVIYEEGLGVKKDLNLALKYYRQAAERGNKLAIKNLERLGQKL